MHLFGLAPLASIAHALQVTDSVAALLEWTREAGFRASDLTDSRCRQEVSFRLPLTTGTGDAGEYEARTFVVGDHIATVAIYAHSASGYIDWRTGYDSNTYELIEPPASVVAGVRRLMTEMRLVYGAFDFIIGPDETWTFLEVNAGGQYGWIEEATGAPITGQLAELLAKGNR